MLVLLKNKMTNQYYYKIKRYVSIIKTHQYYYKIKRHVSIITKQKDMLVLLQNKKTRQYYYKMTYWCLKNNIR